MAPPRRIHELAPDRDPWEIQPGESDKAYAQFRAYLEPGPRRSIKQATEILGATRGRNMSVHYLQQVAAAKRWTERAAAWDRANDREFMLRMVEKRRELVENESKIANAFLAKIIPRIRRITDVDMDRVSPVELGRLVELVMRLMRDAHGVPDKTTTASTVQKDLETPGDMGDRDDMSDEEKLAQLREWNREIADFLDTAAERQVEDGVDR